MGDTEWPWYKQLAGHLFMLLLGPVHFNGELVDPIGNVNYHALVYGVLGTWLWVIIIGGGYVMIAGGANP